MSTNYIEISPHSIKFAHKHEGGAFWNARQTFIADKDASTKENIRSNGLTHSPTVRQIYDGQYELICGERRLRCILSLIDENASCYNKATGQFEPATKIYKNLVCNLEINCDDRRASMLSVSENLERENVSELDLMVYCQDLVSRKKENGEPLYTRKDVSEIMRRSEGWVSQTLSFFSLPDRAKEMLANGTLPRTTAIYLLKVKGDKIEPVLNVLEAMTAQELEEQTAAVNEEIEHIEEQIEITAASEVIAGNQINKVSKTKMMLQEKLEAAKGKKRKIGAPRITPEKLQTAADQVPDSRRGKAIALSHKAIRNMRDELTELKENGSTLPQAAVDLTVLLIDMFLGESEDRTAIQVLEKFYQK